MSRKSDRPRRVAVPKNPEAFKQRERRPGRISSWNYSGTTLFYGLVGGPLLILLAALTIRSGPMKDPEGKPDWIGPYFFGSILIGIAVFLVYRAFTKAALWIDVGDKLRIRKLAHTATREWNEIESVDFENAQRRMPLIKTGIPGFGIDWKFAEHQILVVRFRDQSSIRVEVNDAHNEIIQELVYRHLEARHYREHGKAEA